MNKEDLKQTISVSGETKELEIAHYFPENPKEQKGYSISGTISAITCFLDKRTGEKYNGVDVKKDDYLVDQKDSHILVDREKMTMILTIENSNPYTSRSVTASLMLTEDFAKWQINTGYEWAHRDLAEFIKMNRSCFGTIPDAMDLYLKLRDLKIKVDKEIESINDNSGNAREVAAQNVIESSLPKDGFSIKVRIFKGESKVAFSVEFYVNPHSFKIMLVSPEANDVIQSTVDKAIDKELKQVKELAPQIAIIEK